MSAYTNGDSPSKSTAPLQQRHQDQIMTVQPPRREDFQPSYASAIAADYAPDAAATGWYGGMINSIGHCMGTLGSIPGCFCCPNPYQRGSVGLITKFGRFNRAVDPGLAYVNPLSENITRVDVKIQIVEVPRQVCMTKDNVNLHLTSVIYYHINSPHRAAFGISDIRTALVERTQTTLRHVIGARLLQDVIERREEIAMSIREIIEETAATWGVQVESMLIKDIVFSQELQDSLSMAAQSKRTGEAKVIAARAEVESAKLMRQAADILSSPAAMQIRYLEAMQSMAKTSGSKVIFLPAQNQTVQSQLAQAEAVGEGPSSYGEYNNGNPNVTGHDYSFNMTGLGSAMNARNVENI